VSESDKFIERGPDKVDTLEAGWGGKGDLSGFLLLQIQGGDRQALAAACVVMESRLRRRFRKRLRPALRRMFDSEDLAATTFLRMDEFLHHGFIRAQTAGDLWMLADGIASNLIAEWERRLASERRAISVHPLDRGRVVMPVTPVDAAHRAERQLFDLLTALENDEEREFVMLRAQGLRWRQIACTLGLPCTTLRQRFRTIKLTSSAHAVTFAR
jgi:DNA-directed RNA polymerase specialized sigma24 family protein